MPDTLDKIISIIRDNGYDRDQKAEGSTPLFAACGNEDLDAIDMLAEIENTFDGVVFEDDHTAMNLTLGEIAIEIEKQLRTLTHARAQ